MSVLTKADWAFWETNGYVVVHDAVPQANLNPVLTGVDNITVAADGSLYVAEDGGNLQVVVITAEGSIYPVLELAGHDKSEIAGVAFSPDGKRLYFSSQRGTTDDVRAGMTFEVTGPF